MSNEKKSPFMQNVFVGKHVKGASEYGYMYTWNSSHPDLKPTKTLEYGGVNYCVYCSSKANPIQSRIEKYDDYSVTGYTCSRHCEGCQSELEYYEKLKALEENFSKMKNELSEEYREKLPIAYEKLIKIKHAVDLKRMEREKVDSFKSKYINGLNLDDKSIADIV